jgi:Lrp/AsnC family transcriptional regulator, regulator for asnA, asnC and gidA
MIGPLSADDETRRCQGAGPSTAEPVVIGVRVASKSGQQADGQAPVPRVRARQVDELDRKIIKMLQVDGRLSNTEIARVLEITETTVRKRIAHLLDERLISIVAVPTPEAAGMNLSAIIGISVELTAIHGVADAIRSYTEVRYIGMSAGRYDLMVEAFFTDQEHLLEFVTDKLGGLPGITNLETSIILKVVKFSYEWEIV